MVRHKTFGEYGQTRVPTKSVIFFVIYLFVFGSLLWSGRNIDVIETAQEYEYSLKVFLALLAASTLLPILDLCWSMNAWNVSEVGLSSRILVYFAGVVAAVVLLSQLMTYNSLEAPQSVVQEGKVDTCFMDTDYNQYRTTTQNGVVLYTSEKYEYGQKISYVKATTVKRITREPVVYYSPIPKGALN